MPKYRTLTVDELKLLESIFINFLASNGISGEHWNKIQNGDKPQYHKLINEFSDMIFESVLDKAVLLERHDANTLEVYHINEANIEMIRIELRDIIFDFNEDFDLEQLIGVLNVNKEKYQIYIGEKRISSNRNFEIFQLMEKSCKILKNDDIWPLLKEITT